MPRFHVPVALATDAELALPPTASRHAQVLRLQPGDPVTLFNGAGGAWLAVITHMGRSEVQVRVGAYAAEEREAGRTVHLAFGMMAAERLEWLLEKATELGAARFSPLHTTRGSLRLSSERARAKQLRWQGVVAAACEQCGRNTLPEVALPATVPEALAACTTPARWLLSFDPHAMPLTHALRNLKAGDEVTLLSGPEGGLTSEEENAARAAGFHPITLGPRVLRAETAPLAVLSTLTCLEAPSA